MIGLMKAATNQPASIIVDVLKVSSMQHNLLIKHIGTVPPLSVHQYNFYI